jgi:hypothetical protein
MPTEELEIQIPPDGEVAVLRTDFAYTILAYGLPRCVVETDGQVRLVLPLKITRS